MKVKGLEDMFSWSIFSISDTSIIPHVRNSSNVFLYNTDFVIVILVADL